MPEKKAFLLRIDPALWADLESWAADELRSVNGQIEYLLRQVMTKRKRMMEADASQQATKSIQDAGELQSGNSGSA